MRSDRGHWESSGKTCLVIGTFNVQLDCKIHLSGISDHKWGFVGLINKSGNSFLLSVP